MAALQVSKNISYCFSYLIGKVKFAGTAAIRLIPKKRALTASRAPSKEETELMNKINELLKNNF